MGKDVKVKENIVEGDVSDEEEEPQDRALGNTRGDGKVEI